MHPPPLCPYSLGPSLSLCGVFWYSKRHFSNSLSVIFRLNLWNEKTEERDIFLIPSPLPLLLPNHPPNHTHTHTTKGKKLRGVGELLASRQTETSEGGVCVCWREGGQCVVGASTAAASSSFYLEQLTATLP